MTDVFSVRIEYPQTVLSDVGFMDTSDTKSQKSTALLVHADAIGRPHFLIIVEPFELWFGISSDTSSEFGRHCFVDLAVTDLLQEGWRFYLLFPHTENDIT